VQTALLLPASGIESITNQHFRAAGRRRSISMGQIV